MVICLFTNCCCRHFAQDLLNLWDEILTIECDLQQWAAFECFKRHFLSNYSFMIRADLCNNCPELLRRIHKFKDNGLALSSVLLDLLSVMYCRNLGYVHSSLMDDIQEIPFSSNSATLRRVLALRVVTAFRINPDFMKLLLHSGYLSSLSEESFAVRLQATLSSTEFIRKINKHVDAYSVYQKVVKSLNKVLYRSKEESKIYKRLFLVVHALHAVQNSLEKDHVHADKLISCLKMYFSASRDPFITIFEVRSFLYVTFFHMNALNLFDQYSQEFDRLMPEFPAKMEPRKLTHLARCQIRQNLKSSNCPLPAAINRLGLPKTLKNFVLGDVLDVSGKNGNASSQNIVRKEELIGPFFGQPMI